MEVSGKNVKVWRKDIQGKNGMFYKYTVGISKKTQDGKYVNAYIPVVFSKRADAPEKIENGAVIDFDGFMSVESYTDKEGNTRNSPQIVIMNAVIEDDGFAQAEAEIPF